MTLQNLFITRSTRIRTRLLLAFALLLLAQVGESQQDQIKRKQVRDSDRPRLDAALAELDRPDATAEEREAAIDRTVKCNALVARAKLKAVLAADPSSQVHRTAAKWLAILGDRAGLNAQGELLRQGVRDEPAYVAERLLGDRGAQGDAPVIAAAIRPAAAPLLASRDVTVSPEDRALLKYGIISLARLGRIEDRELIIAIVGRVRTTDFAEALGYVGGEQAKSLLWDLYNELAVPSPHCDQRGFAVPVLLALSRAGDETATARLKGILRGELGPNGTLAGKAALCGDREQAFQLLRARDAPRFAETVLGVAGEEPEGPWTFAAWRALGVMRPRLLADRILSLAVSKRPHWREVSRDLLNKVVMAANPDLNEKFWSYFDVEVVPEMSGEKALIEAGAGHLLFSGTEPWTGD